MILTINTDTNEVVVNDKHVGWLIDHKYSTKPRHVQLDYEPHFGYHDYTRASPNLVQHVDVDLKVTLNLTKDLIYGTVEGKLQLDPPAERRLDVGTL